LTLALLVGNRGFFPNHLCESGRREMMAALEAAGISIVALSPEQTPYGSIESTADARQAADLLRKQADRIDGVVVTLPNFGDERAVADALRWSSLRVPVLVQAFPDVAGRMTIADRRDSFCGKMSVCNNLRQYDIPFTLTTRHTEHPDSPTFRQDLADFAATCRVVKGLRKLRVGALGARPAAFKTVRYSEKLLEKYGVSVDTLDLYEFLGRVDRLSDDSASVQAKLSAIRGYVPAGQVPEVSLRKMARMGVVLDEWMAEGGLEATAIQCWTALEEFFGIVPCTLMSMLSNALLPSACEVDVTGAVAMVALSRASGRPAALVDWNNNYGDDPDKGVVFHCSNLPKGLFTNDGRDARMDYQQIIAGTVGEANSFGTIVGRVAAAPFTYLRIATDDAAGVVRGYLGEGELTDDPLDTFGGYGVVRIPRFQRLLRHICENGFEHHVAITPARVAKAIHEALVKYLGWPAHWHEPPEG